MIHLVIPEEAVTSDIISITGDQARHLALVLRAKPGDTITVLDGRGFKYDCRLLSVHKKEVRAEIVDRTTYSAESPVSITLAQGIPKGDKMDLIIQKSTELGVSGIIPLITERSQVKHTAKLERWKKIAHSAAQQSGRERVPAIEGPVEFEEFLYARGDVRGKMEYGILFSESRQERNMKSLLSGLSDIQSVILLIGPEGGFSKDEITLATEKGFTEVSLGPRILRTETAPIAAISIIQYELGDAGE